MSYYNSVKKSKHVSGKGSENISSAFRGCKREKHTDNMFANPGLHALPVTPSEKGFGTTRKDTEKDKRDSCKSVPGSRYNRRQNVLQHFVVPVIKHVKKNVFDDRYDGESNGFPSFILPENYEHAVTLSASRLKERGLPPHKAFTCHMILVCDTCHKHSLILTHIPGFKKGLAN